MAGGKDSASCPLTALHRADIGSTGTALGWERMGVSPTARGVPPEGYRSTLSFLSGIFKNCLGSKIT